MYPHQHWGLSFMKQLGRLLGEASMPFAVSKQGLQVVDCGLDILSRFCRDMHTKESGNTNATGTPSLWIDIVRSDRKPTIWENKSFKCPLVMALHLRLYGTTWESWEPWNTYNINSNTPLYALLMISCHYKNHLRKSMPVQVRLVCSSVQSTVH